MKKREIDKALLSAISRSWDDDYTKKLNKLIRTAKNEQELVDNLIECDAFGQLSTKAYLVKKFYPSKVWYEIRNVFGDKCRKSYSDAGSLLIGTEEFSVHIPNGYGDGETRYAIFENRADFEYASQLMRFFTSVSGEFDIYRYDCSFDDIEDHLSGRYGVYYYEGLIAFEKWD